MRGDECEVEIACNGCLWGSVVDMGFLIVRVRHCLHFAILPF